MQIPQLPIQAETPQVDIFAISNNIIVKKVDQYGQATLDAVLEIVKIDAMHSLVFAWSAFLVCVLFAYGTYRSHKRRDEPMSKLSMGYIAAAIIGMCIASYTTLNVWSYVAIYNPSLYLIKKVLNTPPVKPATIEVQQ